MPKSRFSAVSVFSLDSSNLCREVKKLQVFYIESFPPTVALDSKIRLSPIYSKYCKWIIFGRKIFKVPAMYSTCCKWLFTNFLFFRQNFFSPRYVLHLLQVADLMYSTYCKWLIFEIFFFALWTIPSPPNVLHMLQVAFEQLFIFWSKFF